MPRDLTRRRQQRAVRSASSGHSGNDIKKHWTLFTHNMAAGEMGLFFIPENPSYAKLGGWIKGRPRISTVDHPLFDGRCVYNYLAEQDEADFRQAKKDGKKASRKIKLRPETVLQIVDLRHYHHQAITHKEGADPQLTPILCKGVGPEPKKRGCRGCLEEDDSIRERQLGGKKKLELSDPVFDKLLLLDYRLSKTCIHRDEDGKVCGHDAYIDAYICPCCSNTTKEAFVKANGAAAAEELGASWQENAPSVIFDKDTCIRYEDQQHIELRNSQVQCPHCSSEVFAKPVYVCETEKHEAKPGSIYDAPITIKCVGKEMKFGKENRTVRDYEFTAEHGFKTLKEILAEIEPSKLKVVKDEETGKERQPEYDYLVRPLDLWRSYKPEFIDHTKYYDGEIPDGASYLDVVMSAKFDKATYVRDVLREQAKSIEVPNPYAGETASEEVHTGLDNSMYR